MGRSTEWHVRTSQPLALELLQQYWWKCGCSVEVAEGPQDGPAYQRYQEAILSDLADETPPISRMLVLATDTDGWTTVSCVYSPWDEVLWKHLTWESQAPILAGEDDTRTGWSRWAWFERGEIQAEHVVFVDGGTFSFHVDEDQQPSGNLSLEDAFAVFGRTYRELPLEGCKDVLVRGDARRERM